MTRNEFLKDLTGWNNHRFWLWPALQSTKGLVVEFGVGDESTPFLHDYCEQNGRTLRSYDDSPEWYDKFKHLASDGHSLTLVKDWDTVKLPHTSVLLIDHGPAERRHLDVIKYADTARFLVVHDTEPESHAAYKLNNLWHRFQYRNHYSTSGTRATVASNFEDVTRWPATL